MTDLILKQYVIPKGVPTINEVVFEVVGKRIFGPDALRLYMPVPGYDAYAEHLEYSWIVLGCYSDFERFETILNDWGVPFEGSTLEEGYYEV